MQQGIQLILDNISKIVSLTKEEQDLFVSKLQYAEYKKKEFFLHEGQFSNELNFIIEGCVLVFYTDQSGFSHLIQFAIEDWWVGDIASSTHNIPTQLNIQAVEKTKVLRLKKEDLETVFEAIPKLERFFRILLQKRAANLQQRIISSLSKTATERFLEFREQYGYLENRITQIQIASFLGVTPEFLSMIRRKLNSSNK